MVNNNKKMKNSKKAQMKNKNIFQLLHKKDGQMKIQQMSFMLIAVFLFFALVGMMVLTVSMNKRYTEALLLEEKNAVLLASKIANSPEFSCGGAYGTEKTDCIDLDKVMVLKDEDRIKNYKDFWGVSDIEIKKIYPEPKIVIECTKENYPACNLIKVTNSGSEEGVARQNFVALCRKEKYKEEIVNKCELGIIMIKYQRPGKE
jgi:hypothetical protein